MVRSERHRRDVKAEDVFMESEPSVEHQQGLAASGCPFNDVFGSGDSPMDQIDTFLKNVQVLLEAASYIESAERKDGSK